MKAPSRHMLSATRPYLASNGSSILVDTPREGQHLERLVAPGAADRPNVVLCLDETGLPDHHPVAE
jgi:hypothetical protein